MIARGVAASALRDESPGEVQPFTAVRFTAVRFTAVRFTMLTPPITRRQFVGQATLAVVALGQSSRDPRPWGRLSARPSATVHAPLPPGVHTLSAVGSRTTVVVVPPKVSPERPAPLILMLHGATESNAESLGAMQQVAGDAGAIL